jgi:hypothetical protein
MNSKGVRFRSARRELVSERLERDQDESRTRVSTNNERTVINRNLIQDLDDESSRECDKSGRGRRKGNTTASSSSRDEDNTSEEEVTTECSDDDEDKDHEYESSSGTIESEDMCDEERARLKESLSLLDRNCQKIVQGRDLLRIYHSFAAWFNDLKDAFTLGSGEPNKSNSSLRSSSRPRTSKSRSVSPSLRNKSYQRSFSSPIHVRNPPRSHSTPKSTTPWSKMPCNSASTKRTVTYDNACDITRNLALDSQLILNYEPSSGASKVWNERDICRNHKYKDLMAKKGCFYDKLCLVPGIGKVYMGRLSGVIPNLGTLLELFQVVDEITFKALLNAYANVNSLNLNLIYTSCKHYIGKFGYTFRDVRILCNRRNR